MDELNYHRAYYALFNEITDVIEILDDLRTALIKIQEHAEEIAITQTCDNDKYIPPVEYTLKLLTDTVKRISEKKP